MNEETLTYLNQGQPYELKIKKIGGSAQNPGGKYYKVSSVALQCSTARSAWAELRLALKLITLELLGNRPMQGLQ